jgi:hypothetical protein
MLDTMSSVRVRYDDRTYSCDFHGSYLIRVAHEGRDIVVAFDPDRKLSRGCGKIQMSKSVARRLGLALLRASVEDEKTQDIEIRDETVA